MRIELLAIVAGVLAIADCPPGGKGERAETGNAIDTIIREASLATRDTIIKYREAGYRDTIIKHAREVPDSCKKVPPPPDCPTRFLLMRIDTIIK